jgi:hypothetical protein
MTGMPNRDRDCCTVARDTETTGRKPRAVGIRPSQHWISARQDRWRFHVHGTTKAAADRRRVVSHCGGHLSAQIRLPDAINRKLLSPFQYFAVTDSENLGSLKWRRGGYRTDDLDRIYTGNDLRAALVIAKVNSILLNPRKARGLCFCVSVAHARYIRASAHIG